MFTNKIKTETNKKNSRKCKRAGATLLAALFIISGCNNNASESGANTVYPDHFNPGSLVEAAAKQDLTGVAKILEQPGYDINEVNGQKENAILIATHLNNLKLAQMLIDAGANINIQDQIEDSAFLYAGAEGRTEILRYMLEKANPRPDQNVYNRYGGNALIPAAEKGHIENVRLLLADGKSDINLQNSFGYTALIEAVALKDGSQIYQDIVKLLLDAGAKTGLRDKSGRSALDYAQEKNYPEMVRMITEAARKEQEKTTENNSAA